MLKVEKGEYIVIDENIIIAVDGNNDMLYISIDAPKEMPIVRGEIYEQDHKRPACLEAEIRTENEPSERKETLQGS